MGQPLFLAENFYNVTQFADHDVNAGGDLSGVRQEVFRVGTARRSVLDVHRNDDPSTDLRNIVSMPRDRSADTLIIDRNSDVIGRTVELEAITNPGDPGQVVFSETVPSDVVLGSSLNDPVHAIRTSEGAWIWHFDATTAVEFHLTVTPLSGDSGSIGGLYLGLSFVPTHGGRLPFDDEETWLDFGVVRRGVPDNDVRHGRTGAFGMMMSGEAEWNEARRQFRELFGKGHPMWIAPDSDKAERTWFGYNAPGSMGAAFSERPQGRSVVIRADEYDPRLP